MVFFCRRRPASLFPVAMIPGTRTERTAAPWSITRNACHLADVRALSGFRLLAAELRRQVATARLAPIDQSCLRSSARSASRLPNSARPCLHGSAVSRSPASRSWPSGRLRPSAGSMSSDPPHHAPRSRFCRGYGPAPRYILVSELDLGQHATEHVRAAVTRTCHGCHCTHQQTKCPLCAVNCQKCTCPLCSAQKCTCAPLLCTAQFS